MEIFVLDCGSPKLSESLQDVHPSPRSFMNAMWIKSTFDYYASAQGRLILLFWPLVHSSAVLR
jgi:hypothetical protein